LEIVMQNPEDKPVEESRILARHLARPLTEEEIDIVSGGARAAAGDTCSETGCPVNDSDC
jgi:hypothetical protein